MHKWLFHRMLTCHNIFHKYETCCVAYVRRICTLYTSVCIYLLRETHPCCRTYQSNFTGTISSGRILAPLSVSTAQALNWLTQDKFLKYQTYFLNVIILFKKPQIVWRADNPSTNNRVFTVLIIVSQSYRCSHVLQHTPWRLFQPGVQTHSTHPWRLTARSQLIANNKTTNGQ